MSPDRCIDLSALVSMFDGVLPLKSDQKFIFSQLTDSIDHCEKLGSSAWSITLNERGFRLNVGQVEVMTCSFFRWEAGEFGNESEIMFVNLRIFLAGADCLTKTDFDDELESIEEGSYSSVGARHWCYSRSFQAASGLDPDSSRVEIEAQLHALRDNRDKYLDLACHTSTGKLRQKSNFARSHCPALYELARIATTDTIDLHEFASLS